MDPCTPGTDGSFAGVHPLYGTRQAGAHRTWLASVRRAGSAGWDPQNSEVASNGSQPVPTPHGYLSEALATIVAMSLSDDLPARIASRVRMTVGKRRSINYALVAGRSDGSVKEWFETPANGMDWRLHDVLRRAGHYWGLSGLTTLDHHLKDPAPHHSMIARWNDEAWIATDAP